MERRKLTDAAGHSGGVVADSTMTRMQPSNWRSPPRPVAKSAEQGSRITGDTGKSVERREGDGRVRSSEEAE